VNTPLRRWLAARHNVVVLEEGDMKRSISKLADVLRQGKNIIIFPEGTRTPDGKLGEFKKMFAILGVELQVPIVPVVINGAFEALPRGRHWPLPKKIVVEFRPPVIPTADTTYDELANEVKLAIEERLRMPKRS
jgi:long-chain acyl-CoA synthetase